jgi:hypothetical protein
VSQLASDAEHPQPPPACARTASASAGQETSAGGESTARRRINALCDTDAASARTAIVVLAGADPAMLETSR